jgi:hypothetical protein
MSLRAELVAELLRELRENPSAAEQVAQALAPLVAEQVIRELPEPEPGGWLDARAAADHLGMSRDGLERAIRDGLRYSQPNGPNGRRFFDRRELDDWVTNGAR